LALIDASNNSQVDSELIDEPIMSTGNLLNHQKGLAIFPSLLCHVSDHTDNPSFQTDTQERAIHLGHVNSFAEVPRSVLQVLCKEFNIKANMTNNEMRQALSLRAQSDYNVIMALQEAIMSNSLAKRVKTEKLSQGDSKISVKRTNTDEDILSKAQRLAAKRNLETSELSFIPFDPKFITSNCEKIGITLGSTENKVLQSVVSIKNIEIDRLTVAAKSTSPFSVNNFHDEEEAVLDDELSHITDRWDDDSELCGLDRCCELTVAPRRKKANRTILKGNVNRPSKKPITPSKISLKRRGFSRIVED
jgi:hypothetical protein